MFPIILDSTITKWWWLRAFGLLVPFATGIQCVCPFHPVQLRFTWLLNQMKMYKCTDWLEQVKTKHRPTTEDCTNTRVIYLRERHRLRTHGWSKESVTPSFSFGWLLLMRESKEVSMVQQRLDDIKVKWVIEECSKNPANNRTNQHSVAKNLQEGIEIGRHNLWHPKTGNANTDPVMEWL